MTKPLNKAHDATVSAWKETVTAMPWIFLLAAFVGLMAHLAGLASVSLMGVL